MPMFDLDRKPRTQYEDYVANGLCTVIDGIGAIFTWIVMIFSVIVITPFALLGWLRARGNSSQ